MEIWSRNRSKFRATFNGVCLWVLLFFLVYKHEILQKPFSSSSQIDFPRRRIYEKIDGELQSSAICTEVHHSDSKCDYLRAHPECNSGGYFNYMMFFYCECNKIEPLGSSCK
ncbi:hypothetical protein ACS0TY_022077 [Phlomoides rotata]